jgi:hypothetical protein
MELASFSLLCSLLGRETNEDIIDAMPDIIAGIKIYEKT